MSTPLPPSGGGTGDNNITTMTAKRIIMITKSMAATAIPTTTKRRKTKRHLRRRLRAPKFGGGGLDQEEEEEEKLLPTTLTKKRKARPRSKVWRRPAVLGRTIGRRETIITRQLRIARAGPGRTRWTDPIIEEDRRAPCLAAGGGSATPAETSCWVLAGPAMPIRMGW